MAVDLHARGTRVLVSDIVELAVHLTVEVTLFRCAQDIVLRLRRAVCWPVVGAEKPCGAGVKSVVST